MVDESTMFNFYLEDTFPLASSLVIMQHDATIHFSDKINPIKKEECYTSLVLMGSEHWENEISAAYLSGVFPSKIVALFTSHQIGLRIFFRVEDKIHTMQKIISD